MQVELESYIKHIYVGEWIERTSLIDIALRKKRIPIEAFPIGGIVVVSHHATNIGNG